MDKQVYKMLDINDKIIDIIPEIEEKISNIYKNIDDIALYNQAKVLNAFRKEKISGVCLGKSTGYGYGDVGREAIENVYKDVFKAEDSLVRIGFVNGTHTIATALRGCLLPGDRLLAITGKPYDTLCEVIGITENPMSLKNYGVTYSQIDLDNDGNIKIDEVCEFLKNNEVKMIHIQRSKGYSLRKSIMISDIKEAIEKIRQINKSVIIMVDNCYGEFVEEKEPIEVGADLACRKLNKKYRWLTL